MNLTTEFKNAWKNVNSVKLEGISTQEVNRNSSWKNVSDKEVSKVTGIYQFAPFCMHGSMSAEGQLMNIYISPDEMILGVQNEYSFIPEEEREEAEEALNVTQVLDDLKKIFEFIEDMTVEENDERYCVSYDSHIHSDALATNITSELKKKNPSLCVDQVKYTAEFNKSFQLTKLDAFLGLTAANNVEIKLGADMKFSEHNQHSDFSIPQRIRMMAN